MANEIACGLCANYDPIMSAKRKRPTARGWCTERSQYPHEEAADQSFPPGVARVDAGQLAKPFIVRSLQIIKECALAEPATADAGAAKLRGIVAKTTTSDGKRRLL